MSPENRVEQTLKDIHLLFAESKEFVVDPDKIIVDKARVFELLKKLNLDMYEVMDCYGATKRQQEMAQRRSEKQGERVLEEYQRRAEDVYAASLIYNGDALSRTNKLVTRTTEQIERMLRHMAYDFERERQRLQENQDDLMEQLQEFKDTNKYLGILENLNRDLDRERDKEEKPLRHHREQPQPATSTKPDVRVNPAYFERIKREEAANRRKKYGP